MHGAMGQKNSPLSDPKYMLDNMLCGILVRLITNWMNGSNVY